MTHNDDSSLRVLVSGMMKRPVRRSGKGGIIDEDNLSRFFNDAGCKVAGVRLVVDAKRDKIRGFGFVDFNDYKSLDLALKLHNKEAKGLAGKDGKLRIERASAATDEGTMTKQEMSDARNQTGEMERTLAFHAARINELVREAMRKQLSGGATQGSNVIEALPPAAFEPPAHKEPAHKANPNQHLDAAESTANNQRNVAMEDNTLSWRQ